MQKLKIPSAKNDIETERTIDTVSARIVLTSQGAAIKHWWLKEKSNVPVSTGAEQSWPDLVNSELSSTEKLPLATFPDLHFTEVRTDVTDMMSKSVWRAILPSGAILEKEYLWQNDPQSKSANFIHLTLTVKNPTKKPIAAESLQLGMGGGLGTIESEKKENVRVSRVLAYPSPTKEVAKLETGQYKAEYQWVGVDNRYYLFALLPNRGQFDHVYVEKTKANPGEVKLATPGLALVPGESKSADLKVYGGPKGYTQLKRWKLGLEHSVDFGYFGFLGKWALKAMYALHRLTGNYGWAIVILTLLLQVIVFPLSMKSYKSMAGMKKIQPKIQELQKRYKDDPKRLNQEMLTLYRESGTNPFGGCLPMIMQLPIFWAFFTMLRNSYELHGAPWIFWVHDLSQRDPYYILPVVMGGGMFLQQRISGTAGTADPAQAKMMSFMPLIFTFMFLKFPSGLVLYWLTNSLISMGTQYWFSKKYA